MEADMSRIGHYVSAVNRNALAIRLLVNDGCLEMEFAIAGLNNQISLGVDSNMRGAEDL